METLFSTEYKWLWVGALGLCLFPFVRKLIWVMTVRNHIRKAGEQNVDDDEKRRLKKRAGFTAFFLCFVFSLVYMNLLFKP